MILNVLKENGWQTGLVVLCLIIHTNYYTLNAIYCIFMEQIHEGNFAKKMVCIKRQIYQKKEKIVSKFSCTLYARIYGMVDNKYIINKKLNSLLSSLPVNVGIKKNEFTNQIQIHVIK